MKSNALFFRNLNKSVKTMFKAACVRRENSMQDVVESLMRKYIKDPTVIEKELKETVKARKTKTKPWRYEE